MRELLAPDDTRDGLRKHGGLLLGIGVLMLLIRKEDDYSDWVQFLLYGAMAAYLYGAGTFTDRYTDGVRPWQAVQSVFGLLFVPLALGQFVEAVDGDAGSSLNTFWIFGVTAALAFYAGAVKGIRFQLLAGSIATIVAWSALMNEFLGDEGIAGNFGKYRALLGVLSILLLAFGLWLWRQNDDSHVSGTGTDQGGDRGLWKASELLTGAGIAAVIACGLGITSVGNLSPVPIFEFSGVDTTVVWDVLLLLVSLGLIGLGTQIGVRGPVYIGAIGLILFLFIVGLDLDEDEPDPTNLGLWPIVLIVGGALAVALSAVKESSLGDQPKQLVTRLRGR
jgi:hypothetical protein